MFKKTHTLKNGRELEILRCTNDDLPYIKSLKNIMDDEVQTLYHMGTYKTTRMYYFKKLMADPEDEYAQIPISAGLSSGNRNIFLLAVIDNEIAGYVIALGMWKKEESPARKNICIWDIEVISKYRRLSVAFLLMEALKEWSAENGYENIYSESRLNSTAKNTGRDNLPGINLFLKTGAIELHNIDIKKAVLFGEEEQYEEVQIDDENMSETSRFRLETRAKSYKWIIK
jgi:GNAT superfamily N-acetyltransferase